MLEYDTYSDNHKLVCEINRPTSILERTLVVLQSNHNLDQRVIKDLHELYMEI